MPLFVLLLGIWLVQASQGPVPLAVYQAIIDYPEFEPYLVKGSGADEGLRILRNAHIPAHYKLYKYGRAVPIVPESLLQEYTLTNYLIFQDAWHAGDSAMLVLQSRGGGVEASFELRRIEKNWQVTKADWFRLP
ncbi:MAG: hypothetical protein ACK417_03195 [Bacteroidia bacterium]